MGGKSNLQKQYPALYCRTILVIGLSMVETFGNLQVAEGTSYDWRGSQHELDMISRLHW